MTTTLAESEQDLHQQWRALNEYEEGDGAVQMLLHAGDVSFSAHHC